jgi:hypothetical protein
MEDLPDEYISDSENIVITETEVQLDFETWVDINSEELLGDWLWITDEVYTDRTFNDWCHFCDGQMPKRVFSLIDPDDHPFLYNMWATLKISGTFEDFYSFLK